MEASQKVQLFRDDLAESLQGMKEISEYQINNWIFVSLQLITFYY